LPLHWTQQERHNLYSSIPLLEDGLMHQRHTVFGGEKIRTQEQYDKMCLCQVRINLLLAKRTSK